MPAPHQAQVQQQFDRQAAHYQAGSAMADRAVLDAVLAAAPACPGQHVLDVACGAGFLLRAYRDAGADVTGVDLSAAMLRGAAGTLGLPGADAPLALADAVRLPFADGAFDLVTCKLAFHYFPEPSQAAAELARVCRRTGRVAVIDRVADDDPARREAHNRVEKLRTPNKVRVYSGAELAGLLESAGLAVVRRAALAQQMGFEEWMAAAGALGRAGQVRALLLGPGGEDLTGLAPREEAGRLLVSHRTLVLVAVRATATRQLAAPRPGPLSSPGEESP